MGIRDEGGYEHALAEIESIFDAKRNTPEGDRLDALVSLVEDYEQEHYPIPLPDPIDALLYHLDSRGITPEALEPSIGSAARVAEVLDRKRPLTIRMIRRLHQDLGIAAEALIQPTVAPEDAVPLGRPFTTPRDSGDRSMHQISLEEATAVLPQFDAYGVDRRY